MTVRARDRVARAERLRAFDNGVLNERAHVDQFRVEAGELFFKAAVRIYSEPPCDVNPRCACRAAVEKRRLRVTDLHGLAQKEERRVGRKCAPPAACCG